MIETDEGRAAKRVLLALEQGGASIPDAAITTEDLDPVLVHAIISFLRETHPASNPVSSGVLARVVELTSASPRILKKHQEGGRDPIVEWFLSEHDYGDFFGRGNDLIDVLVDKLES